MGWRASFLGESLGPPPRHVHVGKGWRTSSLGESLGTFPQPSVHLPQSASCIPLPTDVVRQMGHGVKDAGWIRCIDYVPNLISAYT